MDSPVVKTTIQSCILNAISNLMAQTIKAYRSNTSYAINWTPVFQFVLFNAKELDREEKTKEMLESKLSIKNTLIKFLLDQTIGATINTLLFSLAFAGFRGADYTEAVQVATEEFWPVMRAGWTLWPAVSFANYALIKSVEGRALMGSLAGMGWGVYLSLLQK
ncbi:Mpv17/PMP22 family protein [Diplocarpon rosae]|nr:Mpv17/PMP22 family protein [Diplocarpon rosae]